MKLSAGILLYRSRDRETEFFLVHPGGPFWAKKEVGAWSIPKGEYGEGEDPLDAARREFAEETGFDVDGRFIPLTPVKAKGGKLISAWAVEGNVDATKLKSNSFEMEWPPRSGKKMWFPEVDRGGWFNIAEARELIVPVQAAFLEEVSKMLEERGR